MTDFMSLVITLIASCITGVQMIFVKRQLHKTAAVLGGVHFNCFSYQSFFVWRKYIDNYLVWGTRDTYWATGYLGA